MSIKYNIKSTPSQALKNVGSGTSRKIVLDPVSTDIPRSSDVKHVEYLFRGTVEKDPDGGLRYKDSGGNWVYIDKIGQLPAELISENDVPVEGQEHKQQLDDTGFTHPNLHRRIDPQMPKYGSGEVAPRKYKLQIQNLNSYRTTQLVTHIDDYELREYEDDPNYTLICIRSYDQELKEIP